MKKIFYLFIIIGVLSSCAPGKTNQQVKISIYCDDCDMTIINRTVVGETEFLETIFSGSITGSKMIDAYRFDAPNQCIRVSDFNNNTPNNIVLIVIENGDTTGNYLAPDDSAVNYGLCL